MLTQLKVTCSDDVIKTRILLAPVLPLLLIQYAKNVSFTPFSWYIFDWNETENMHGSTLIQLPALQQNVSYRIGEVGRPTGGDGGITCSVCNISLVSWNFPLKFAQKLLCMFQSQCVNLQLDRSSNKGVRANSAPAGPILTRPAPNENLDKSRTLYNSSNDRRAKNGLKITVGPVFQEL